MALCAITREAGEAPKLHAVYSRVHGRQVGLHLVSTAAKLLVAERHEKIQCEIFEGNRSARKYFEALGFREVGSRPSDTYEAQQLIGMEALSSAVETTTHVLLSQDAAR